MIKINDRRPHQKESHETQEQHGFKEINSLKTSRGERARKEIITPTKQ